MTLKEYVALSLLKAWFPKRYNDAEWLESQDGQAWVEISFLDAQVAIDAQKEYMDNKYAC